MKDGHFLDSSETASDASEVMIVWLRSVQDEDVISQHCPLFVKQEESVIRAFCALLKTNSQVLVENDFFHLLE